MRVWGNICAEHETRMHAVGQEFLVRSRYYRLKFSAYIPRFQESNQNRWLINSKENFQNKKK